MPSISSASRSADSGACSGGLTTTVLPAASGAADLPAANMKGWLNGMMRADDAERLAHGEVDRVRPHRDRRALHLGDEAGEEIELRRAGDVGVAHHLGIRVAAIGGVEHGKLVAVLAQRRRRCARSIFARSSGGTRRQSLNAALARGDRCFGVGAPAVGDLAQRLAGARGW